MATPVVKYRDKMDTSALTWQLTLTDSMYRELMAIFLEADASSSIALRKQLGSAVCVGSANITVTEKE